MLRLLPISIWILAFAFSGVIHAEEKVLSPEEEAKIEAQEDADPDAKMTSGLKGIFTGMLDLDGTEKPVAKTVIGKFYVKDGPTYQVKADNDALIEKLTPFSGKTVTVTGKLRVNGKYLIITSVVPVNADAPARDKRKRNGL